MGAGGGSRLRLRGIGGGGEDSGDSSRNRSALASSGASWEVRGADEPDVDGGGGSEGGSWELRWRIWGGKGGC